MNKREIIEAKRKEAQDKSYRWYNFIFALADGDITKFEKIMDLNFIFCLNHLGYRKIYKV